MNSLKEIPSRVWAFVLKHSNVVVTVLVCLCFFFFYKVSNDTKRYEELHNLQMENVMIVNDIRQSMDMLGEQSRHIDAMEEALEMRTDQLNEAASFINLLIKKLQSLGEWPLKEESLPRPGSPTKSEA
jgi:hypothetical protein